MYLVPTPQRFFLFVEPTVGHRANVAEWRQRRHFAAFALSCIGVKQGDFLFRFFLPERWQFSAVLRSCSHHGRAKFWRTDGELFCHFCRSAPPRVRQAGCTEHPRSAHLYKLHFVSFVVQSAMLKKPRNGGNFRDGNFRDGMCNCNTVTRDAITIAIWSGLHPDTLLV